MMNISTTNNANIEDFTLFIGTNWNRGLLEAFKRGRKHSNNLSLYRLYCQYEADHDVVRLHELIREQDFLYFLMIHNHDESVPVNALPMDLLRHCKSFLG